MITESKWTNSFPLDTVEVSPSALILRPAKRTALQLPRSEIDRVEFERIRLPLVRATVFAVRKLDGSRVPKMFQALRPRRLMDDLHHAGYDVVEVSSVNGQ